MCNNFIKFTFSNSVKKKEKKGKEMTKKYLNKKNERVMSNNSYYITLHSAFYFVLLIL